MGQLADLDDSEDVVIGFHHAHQMVEKLLKALLVAAGRSYPLTHDLDRLIGLVAEIGKDMTAYFASIKRPSRQVGNRRPLGSAWLATAPMELVSSMTTSGQSGGKPRKCSDTWALGLNSEVGEISKFATKTAKPDDRRAAIKLSLSFRQRASMEKLKIIAFSVDPMINLRA